MKPKPKCRNRECVENRRCILWMQEEKSTLNKIIASLSNQVADLTPRLAQAELRINDLIFAIRKEPNHAPD